jgi:DNA-binding LacI/PurR family transcriptional regulator
VLAAVRELNYRPNLAARSLRTRRTYTIAALASDISNPHVAAVLAGIERILRTKGYALLIASCELDARSFEAQELRLRQRCVEGVLVVDALLPRDLMLPSDAIEISDHARPESSWDDLRRELVGAGESGARRLLQKVEHNSAPTKVAMVAQSLDEFAAREMEIAKPPAAGQFQFAD